MVSGCLNTGLPTFTKQPSDVNVTRNSSFTLTCEAVGPPNPVTIMWLLNGQKLNQTSPSPSTITIQGKCCARGSQNFALTDFVQATNITSFQPIDKCNMIFFTGCMNGFEK